MKTALGDDVKAIIAPNDNNHSIHVNALKVNTANPFSTLENIKNLNTAQGRQFNSGGGAFLDIDNPYISDLTKRNLTGSSA